MILKTISDILICKRMKEEIKKNDQGALRGIYFVCLIHVKHQEKNAAMYLERL